MSSFKEKRGRKRVYDFPKDKGKKVTFGDIDIPISFCEVNTIRNSLQYYAKRRGMKYRTWMSEGKLIVECL